MTTGSELSAAKGLRSALCHLLSVKRSVSIVGPGSFGQVMPANTHITHGGSWSG